MSEHHNDEEVARRPLKRLHVEEVGLQIAPMVDVTMLLLFFFMLTGKLTQGMKLMQVDLPKAATATEQKEKGDRDVLNIDEHGQLFSGDRQVTDKEAVAHLKNRLKEVPPLKVYVRADSRTPAKRIKQVMNMAAEAGAVTVIFGAHNK
ncbi:biopolymer transporter ExbD [Verrucomicrobium sp. BvORR106]|uniref:ExbD/TolR family protein n=1 Tax=Verrucomicrobium sp. BvORR106 TaxID=1403819 RepID=UPI00056E39F3|nr:biopolymer transporter ExbD [Verrucomicrobium sp. BvORR106]